METGRRPVAGPADGLGFNSATALSTVETPALLLGWSATAMLQFGHSLEHRGNKVADLLGPAKQAGLQFGHSLEHRGNPPGRGPSRPGRATRFNSATALSTVETPAGG